MTAINTDVELEVGGGAYMPGGGIGADLKLRNVKVTFHERYCLKHNTALPYDGHCRSCDDRTRDLMKEHLGLSGFKHVSCANIIHEHTCSCHLGHECGTHCSEHGKGHALEQLAASGESQTMLAIYARLDALERENAALNSVVTGLLQNLPETVSNAAVTAAFREKIGLGAVSDDTVGGAKGV